MQPLNPLRPLVNTDEAAKRLAKTIIQDISLYNSEKVKEALRNDRLFEEMAVEFKEGEDLYRSKVAPEILQRTNYFDRAINDFLLKEVIMRNKGDIQSKIA